MQSITINDNVTSSKSCISIMKKLAFIELILLWVKHGDPYIYYYFRDNAVIDIGCGNGKFLKRNPKKYIGVDISENLVAECKQKGFNAVLGQADRIPFDDSSIKAINCDNVIEHLTPDVAAVMINEFGRVLESGGVAIIRSPLGESVWDTFSHIRPYPPSAIQKLLTKETEDFVRPKDNHLNELEILHVYYQGKYFKNKIIFLLSQAWTNIVPESRKYAYVAILRKK